MLSIAISMNTLLSGGSSIVFACASNLGPFSKYEMTALARSSAGA